MDVSVSSLSSLLESALARPWYALPFGMPMERWYNQDTAPSRVRHITITVTIGVLFIMVFLVSDRALIRDVFIQALILRGILTPFLVAVGLFWTRRTKSVAVRESVIILFGLLTELISVYLMVNSDSPYRGDYLSSVFLIMLYVNIVAKPRFSFAVVATAICLAAVFGSLILTSDVAYPVRLWLAGVTIAIGALTLACNFQLDRQARQHYLMTIQEQLRLEELVVKNFDLKSLSEKDPLTGLYNRRALEHQIGDLFCRSQGSQSPISVLMIDVDHFKAYNDHFGHPMGDRCLQTIAATLIEQTRDGDLVARYGGEEFIIVMPRADRSNVLSIAERIRRAIETRAIPSPPLRDIGRSEVVTASFGVATCDHALEHGAIECACSPSDLIRRADQSLYAAKATGRNRVSCG